MTPQSPSENEGAQEGSVPPAQPEALVRSLAPILQANFLGAFSFFYTAIYTGFALFNDKHSVPPWFYFATMGAIYFLFWLPFYIARFRVFGNALVKVWRRLVDAWWKIGDLLSRTTSRETETSVAIAPDDVGSIRNPVQVERLSTSRWPLPEALRVQLLAVGVVTMAAWYTVYCGGPFKSPFGLILFALPLLSPNIAAQASSIAWVYLVSLVDVLATSALVSWLPRRTDERKLEAQRLVGN
jgi:hypothetical protein